MAEENGKTKTPAKASKAKSIQVKKASPPSPSPEGQAEEINNNTADLKTVADKQPPSMLSTTTLNGKQTAKKGKRKNGNISKAKADKNLPEPKKKKKEIVEEKTEPEKKKKEKTTKENGSEKEKERKKKQEKMSRDNVTEKKQEKMSKDNEIEKKPEKEKNKTKGNGVKTDPQPPTEKKKKKNKLKLSVEIAVPETPVTPAQDFIPVQASTKTPPKKVVELVKMQQQSRIAVLVTNLSGSNLQWLVEAACCFYELSHSLHTLPHHLPLIWPLLPRVGNLLLSGPLGVLQTKLNDSRLLDTLCAFAQVLLQTHPYLARESVWVLNNLTG
ncbi:nucleolar protein 58-like [Salmo trutta]|uniref:nucleolar protein 58-like n=1 Tax=Salmo trutta TaxID=8032 RepID=UPI001130C0F8|nr:nucleolar protein 58-like [Salmo trutta]